MNGALRMLLSPIAGYGTYGVVQFINTSAAWAAGAVVMLAFALLPSRRATGFTQA